MDVCGLSGICATQIGECQNREQLLRRLHNMTRVAHSLDEGDAVEVVVYRDSEGDHMVTMCPQGDRTNSIEWEDLSSLYNVILGVLSSEIKELAHDLDIKIGD